MGRRIGRYDILGKIAQGGMAEVWLARQSGPGGFSKPAVIKQILPQLAQDAMFRQMFLEEARLAALINHPNVVHIYELGDDAETGTYSAMEFIDGVTLKGVAEKAADTGVRAPYELVGRVISDACAGLDAAHELKSLDGEPLNIVHRDVSPDNILISYSGQVKIVDFGIARAAAATSERTRSGVFKGKLAYASPEYLEGQPTDRRVDIWALGVTLYWTLTGRKPFAATAPEALRHQIATSTQVPPREIDPGIPWELEEIVTRALEKDPNHRYQTARELQSAVDTWLRATGQEASNLRLSDYMNQLFPAETDPERLRLHEMTVRVERRKTVRFEDDKTVPAIEGQLDGPSGRRATPSKPGNASLGDLLFDAETSTAIGAGRIDLPPPDLALDSTGSAPLLEGPPTTTSIGRTLLEEGDAPAPRRSLRVVGYVAAAAVIGVGAWAVIARTSTRPRHPPSFPRPAPVTTPPNAVAATPPAAAPPSQVLVPAPAPPAPVVTAPPVVAPPPVAPPTVAPPTPGHNRVARRASRAGPATGPGELMVQVAPWADVFVDGQKVGTTPFAPIELPAGRHEVRLENGPLHVVRKMAVQVRAGKTAVVKATLQNISEEDE
jgi:eukaryotic-like serine/threonine-protein kinase